MWEFTFKELGLKRLKVCIVITTEQTSIDDNNKVSITFSTQAGSFMNINFLKIKLTFSQNRFEKQLCKFYTVIFFFTSLFPGKTRINYLLLF